jgi:hypothetical protein
MKFRFSQLALLTLVCLTLVGCRKEDPQPELKDPIYKDLNTRAGDYEKAVTEGQTQVKDLRLAIEKI